MATSSFPQGLRLVSPPEEEVVMVRRGRPPLNGVRAMTRAELKRRYRAKKNEGKPKKTFAPELLPGPLTAQIARPSFVRQLIDESFPFLAHISSACNQRYKDAGLRELPKTHAPVAAGLVGTAIDYRIRFYFTRCWHESSAVLCGRDRFRLNRWPRESKQLNSLLASLDKFVVRVKPERRRLSGRSEEKLCRYAVVLAHLDRIYRAPGSGAIEELASILRHDPKATLRLVDDALVADVVALSKRFYDGHADLIRSARKVVIGGTLAGSADVGGADFDLLVHGCLIDFKATRKAKVTTKTLRQLEGYWLLDYEDQYKIRSFAVTLLRHGHMERFDIERDLGPAEKFEVLRSNFRRGLKRAKQSASDMRR